MDVSRFELGISSSRQAWVVRWLTEQLAQGPLLVKTVQEALGRLGFAAGPLDQLRPFLGPIYAWVSAVHPRAFVHPPLLVWLSMKFLLAAAKISRTISCRHQVRSLGELFRLDAKAEGDDVVVGGWRTGAVPDTKTAEWFAITLTRKNAGWAYAKGEAFRTIASLELFAFLVGICLFVGKQPHADYEGSISFTSYTDNQGNGYLLDKLQTTKMPLAAILMEVGWQLQMKNVTADLQWVPRDQNCEADALTNGWYDGFDMNKRIIVEPEQLGFCILPELLAAEAEYVAVLSAAKEVKKRAAETRPSTASRPKVAEHSFRLRNPW
jgi:hypothetical protein